MSVFEFDSTLEKACELFEGASTDIFKSEVALSMLNMCTNKFEETCVVERLKELRS